MRDYEEFGTRRLERPEQYEGEDAVTIEAWPSTGSRYQRRSERLAILAEWLAFFERPQPIRRMRLACRVNDELLGALAPQTQLESLELFWGPYRDLGALVAMTGLRSLRLGGASALTDLSPLTRLVGLRELELTNVRALTDYAPLAALTSLRTLTVHPGMTGPRSNADSLKFIRSLTGLDELWWDPRVSDGDYSPLLELRSASRIGVTPMTGMTPSLVDLEWALPGIRAVNEEQVARRIPIVTSDGERAVLTADVTGKPVVVPADPDEVFPDEVLPVDESPAAQIVGPVGGLTLRTISSSARTRTERFWLHLESPRRSVATPPGAETIVSTFAFSGDAAGPILVWDSPVDPAGDAMTFFSGNTDAWTYEEPVRLDASTVAPLPDEDFWTVMDMAGGRANFMASFPVMRTLISRGEPFVLRWAHSLSVHALRLLPVIEDLRERGVLRPGDEWRAIGAVIAAGRTVYERVRTSSDAFDSRLLRNADTEILVVAEKAMRSLRPDVRAVITPLSLAAKAASTAEHTEPTLPDAAPLLQCARGIVAVADGYRERIVIVAGNGEADERSIARAVVALESFGGEVVAGPEFSGCPVHDLAHADVVFTTRRRSSLPIEQYLDRYAPTDPSSV